MLLYNYRSVNRLRFPLGACRGQRHLAWQVGPQLFLLERALRMSGQFTVRRSSSVHEVSGIGDAVLSSANLDHFISNDVVLGTNHARPVLERSRGLHRTCICADIFLMLVSVRSVT